MYVLEIETKDKLKRIENPRKARFVDRIFFDILEVMDCNGDWHKICKGSVGIDLQGFILKKIEDAIKNKKKSIDLGDLI